MRSLVCNSHPGKVIFGSGTLISAPPGEVERVGCERLLILSTPGHEALARAIAERLGGRTHRAVANPYWNPRPLDFEPIQSLIARAWAGRAPEQ